MLHKSSTTQREKRQSRGGYTSQAAITKKHQQNPTIKTRFSIGEPNLLMSITQGQNNSILPSMLSLRNNIIIKLENSSKLREIDRKNTTGVIKRSILLHGSLQRHHPHTN